jgi:DDE superfamily endonuclease
MNLHFSESEDEEEENVIKKRKTTSHLIPILAGTIMQQYINGALYGGVPLSNRPSMIIRERYCISVRNICNKLGDSYFKRAYRMSYERFEQLVQLVEPYLPMKKGLGPNGKIPAELEVSAAVRYFAGASMYDLILSHGMSHTTLFCSVWRVVWAINNCEELQVTFPSDHEQQRSIARQFLARSAAKFGNCVGCIDGLLIHTEKPMERELELTKCGSSTFYCGRKNKFGYNMQGVCDADGKFTAVWILHPAASSDYISLIRSKFYKKISTPGFLAPGCVIFGDNAYVSTDFMVTPYKNVRAGPKDDFNFYHSQLRITIERAFGMLVRRWAVLRYPMASRMGSIKQIALTMCLCSLHNFCTASKETLVFENDDDDVPNVLL